MTDRDQRQTDDVPAQGDRGWRGLARDPGEGVAWIGILALLAVVVLATVLWGLPGLLMAFVLLTLVIMVVLVIISVGS
jgi:hypothetical protein